MTDTEKIERVRVSAVVGSFPRTRSFFGGWPLSRIDVSDDQIDLKIMWKNWTFPKSEIETIVHDSGLRPGGFHIRHRVAGSEPRVRFITYSVEKVLEVLSNHGYTVESKTT